MMLTYKQFYLIVTTGLLVLAGLACQFSVGDVEEGEPGVTGITICKAVDNDQKCEDQTELFKATEKIYTSVQVANLSIEDRVAARWFQGTEQITVGEQDEFEVTNQAGSGYISFFLEPGSSLQPGNYSIQVFLNDSLAQTGNFQIEGEEPPPAENVVEEAVAPTEVEEVPPPTENAIVVQNITTCLTINDDYQCQDQTTTFGPTEVINASVEVANASAGIDIVAHWLQGEEVIGQATFPIEGGGDGFIGFNLKPDKAFQTGPYAVEIYQDEMLIERIDLLVEGDETMAASEPATDWQTFDSDTWAFSVDYPAGWQVEDTEDSVAFLGVGKTLFYLTGYVAESAAEEENQKATQTALDNLTAEFSDFQSTELEPFIVNGLPGLTSDYGYTDNTGDYLNGSIIVVTSDSGNTYIIYIEALADDYGMALDNFNGMLQSLAFK